MALLSMNAQTKGILSAIASAVAYGMNPMGALPLYREGYSTASVLFYRFSFAFILLGALLFLQAIMRKEQTFKAALRHSFGVTKKEVSVLALLGVLFGSSAIALYESFNYMSSGIACTLVFLYPVITAILMAIFFHEKLRVPTISSIVISLIGVTLLSNGSGGVSLIGSCFVGWSALAYSIYIIVINKSSVKMSSVKLTFFVLIFCTLTIFIYSLLFPTNVIVLPHTPNGWIFGGVLALVPTVLSLVFMTIAVHNIGSTPTAILGALEPVTAVAIGVFVFHELFTIRLAIGVLLILFSVLIVIAEKALSPHRLTLVFTSLGKRFVKKWRWRS